MKHASISFRTILSLAFFATLAQGQTTYTFRPVAKFTYAGARSTLALGIDSSNNVVGAQIPEGAEYANGFERYADGTFSAPIIAPGSDVIQTIASAINDTGTIAGYYTTNLAYTHGFFLKDGVYTVFDYPGVYLTMLQGINDVGDFVGWYENLDQTSGAFASIGGNLIAIAIPNSTYNSPSDINNHGEIVGWYNRPNNSISFLREMMALCIILSIPGEALPLLLERTTENIASVKPMTGPASTGSSTPPQTPSSPMTFPTQATWNLPASMMRDSFVATESVTEAGSPSPI